MKLELCGFLIFVVVGLMGMPVFEMIEQAGADLGATISHIGPSLPD